MTRDLIDQASRHHRAGRLDEAERLYSRALTESPEDGDILHRLGAVVLQRGDAETACDHLEAAADQRPDDARVQYNLGVARQARGQDDDAEAAFRRAIDIEPGYAAADINLGRLHLGRGDRDGAIACFKRAVASDDSLAEAHFNLGDALRETGRLDDEIACYRLGLALLEQSRFDEATAAILVPVRRMRPLAGGDDQAATFNRTNPTKLACDGEQLRHLIDAGLIDASYGEVVAECDRMLAAWGDAPDGEAADFPLPPSRRFKDGYNRLLHHAEVSSLDGPAINPGLDPSAIEAAFLDHPAGLTHVDDFLTDDALAGLQRFCRDPTVWYQMQFPGELSASLPNGFCCPLLLQVAREIRLALPAIFGDHVLTTFWAYKYFGASSGIEIHADRGAVSVNLWITPDSANRDPDTGGLVLWDRLAPDDYFGAPRHRQIDILRHLVDDPAATCLTVPYRCNRAILFRSNVVHRTDDLDFKASIENRRVNVTFIYGHPGG